MALPLAPPWQPTAVCAVMDAFSWAGSDTVQLAVNVQQGGAFYTSCDLGGTSQYSPRVATPCGALESPALNAKQVRIAPGSFTGPFTVQIVAKGINAKAVPTMLTPNQDFAVFVYNAVRVP